jgi:hypothetical protein
MPDLILKNGSHRCRTAKRYHASTEFWDLVLSLKRDLILDASYHRRRPRAKGISARRVGKAKRAHGSLVGRGDADVAQRCALLPTLRLLLTSV